VDGLFVSQENHLMSNRAYLIASQDSTPAGRNSDGDANYDEQRDVLADGGGYQLPVFWLSLFSESDICFHQFDEYRVSTLVCQRESALNQMEQRRDSVLAAFPGCEAHWRVWHNLVEGSTAAYFKVDATELWDLDPDLFEDDFRAAVRWFSSGDDSDYETLLSVGILAFDASSNQFTVGGSQLVGEHLYGYLMKASPPSGPPPLPASGPLPPPLPTQSSPQSTRPWWKLFS
jgi:hypothetical protein